MKIVKNSMSICLSLLIIFSFVFPSFTLTAYADEAVNVSLTYSDSTSLDGLSDEIVPFDRGSCGDFKNIPHLHNRYCNRKRPPGRNLTARERSCVIGLLGSAIGILAWTTPITWQQVVTTFGPSVLACVFG